MTYLVGLTGGIGSGKSAATDRFSEHDIAVVDADIASRAVVEPGQPALAEIAAHFGEDILDHQGQLDRTKLRHRIFAEPAERKWLQTLLHPLINAYLKNEIGLATSPYVILANPLLIESGQYVWCDRILVIDVPREIQIERTMSRNQNTREQVENILKAQTDRETRLSRADDVISNDSDLATLHAAVDNLHAQYCKKATTA
ncbi:MAG: dephospho-CoA kinase [Pseudomonadales bacterium]|nr:dephospho-CoA kinase [Pseudomonadales bacterium]